jgi:hypothetical protein
MRAAKKTTVATPRSAGKREAETTDRRHKKQQAPGFQVINDHHGRAEYVLVPVDAFRSLAGAGAADEGAWLDEALAEQQRRLDILEAEVPPKERAGWLESLRKASKAVRWDEARNDFIQVPE